MRRRGGSCGATAPSCSPDAATASPLALGARLGAHSAAVGWPWCASARGRREDAASAALGLRTGRSPERARNAGCCGVGALGALKGSGESKSAPSFSRAGKSSREALSERELKALRERSQALKLEMRVLLKRRRDANPDASDPQMQLLFSLRVRLRDTQAPPRPRPLSTRPPAHAGCRRGRVLSRLCASCKASRLHAKRPLNGKRRLAANARHMRPLRAPPAAGAGDSAG